MDFADFFVGVTIFAIVLCCPLLHWFVVVVLVGLTIGGSQTTGNVSWDFGKTDTGVFALLLTTSCLTTLWWFCFRKDISKNKTRIVTCVVFGVLVVMSWIW